MSKQATSPYTLILYAEIALLIVSAALILLPINREPAISTSPNTPSVSYVTKELRRIQHQSTHYPLVLFSVPAQDYRADTAIRFRYRTPDTFLPTYLQFEHNGQFEDYALAFHPLLPDIDWPSIQEENFRLYQKTPVYTSIQDMLNNLPNASEIAADRVAARVFGLSQNSYSDLDSMQDTDTVTYILTSYQPTQPDGWWMVFDQSFDFSELVANDSNKIVGRLSSIDDTKRYESPLYIGDFHVDYKKMRY